MARQDEILIDKDELIDRKKVIRPEDFFPDDEVNGQNNAGFKPKKGGRIIKAEDFIPDEVIIPSSSRIAFQHNNPGNLVYAGQAGATKGEHKKGKVHWAMFDSPQAGYDALIKDIEIKKSGKSETGITGESTVKEYFQVYAPPSENDTIKYTNEVAEALGVSPDTKIKDIDTKALARQVMLKESGSRFGEPVLSQIAQEAKLTFDLMQDELNKLDTLSRQYTISDMAKDISRKSGLSEMRIENRIRQKMYNIDDIEKAEQKKSVQTRLGILEKHFPEYSDAIESLHSELNSGISSDEILKRIEDLEAQIEPTLSDYKKPSNLDYFRAGEAAMSFLTPSDYHSGIGSSKFKKYLDEVDRASEEEKMAIDMDNESIYKNFAVSRINAFEKFFPHLSSDINFLRENLRVGNSASSVLKDLEKLELKVAFDKSSQEEVKKTYWQDPLQFIAKIPQRENPQYTKYLDEVLKNPYISATQRLLKDNKRIQETIRQESLSRAEGGKTRMGKLWGGLSGGTGTAFRKYPETFDKLRENPAINRVMDKAEKAFLAGREPDFSPDELNLYLAVEGNNVLMQSLDPQRWTWWNVGEGVGANILFPLEFGLTRGIFKAAQMGAESYLLYDHLRRSPRYIAWAKGVAQLAGVTAQTAMLPSFYVDYFENISNNERPIDAFVDAYRDNFIEVFTESLFVGNASKVLSTNKVSKLNRRFLERIGSSLADVESGSGLVLAIFEEYLEEKIEEVLSAPYTQASVKDFALDFFNPEKNAHTLSVVVGTSSIMGSPVVFGSAAQNTLNKITLNRARKLLDNENRQFREEVDIILNDKNILIEDAYHSLFNLMSDYIKKDAIKGDLSHNIANVLNYAFAKTKNQVFESFVGSILEKRQVADRFINFLSLRNEAELADIMREKGLPVPENNDLRGLPNNEALFKDYKNLNETEKEFVDNFYESIEEFHRRFEEEINSETNKQESERKRVSELLILNAERDNNIQQAGIELFERDIAELEKKSELTEVEKATLDGMKNGIRDAREKIAENNRIIAEERGVIEQLREGTYDVTKESIEVTPENRKDLEKIVRDIFGERDNNKIDATVTVVDAIIGTMAKRRGMTKAEVYETFDFKRVSPEELSRREGISVEEARGSSGAAVIRAGRNIIYAITAPNISTPLHEMAHIFEPLLTDAERQVILDFAKTKEWSLETSEKFARSFEKYLADGIAPNEALREIFDNFKQWMLDIYRRIRGSNIDIKINQPMRELFDRMLTEGESEIKTETDGKFRDVRDDGQLRRQEKVQEQQIQEESVQESEAEVAKRGEAKAEPVAERTEKKDEASEKKIKFQEKNLKETFNKREKLLNLLYENERKNIERKPQQLDDRRKGIEVSFREKSRYDSQRGERTLRDVALKEISLNNSEFESITKFSSRSFVDDFFLQINNGQLFFDKINLFKNDKSNAWSASVAVHEASDYNNHKLYITSDGFAGLAIDSNNNIISVFSHKEGRGRVHQMFLNAIKDGGNKLDNYDTILSQYYYDFGFVPVARLAWNDLYAPSDWNYAQYERFNNGRPDIVFMAYHGGDIKSLHERLGKFGMVSELLSSTPYVESYEDGQEAQDTYIKNIEDVKTDRKETAEVSSQETAEKESKEQVRVRDTAKNRMEAEAEKKQEDKVKFQEVSQTIEVDGKNRPTTNNEGQQIHPTEQGIRNFWKWFGDSKVVDEKNNPIRVFTGTSKDVDFTKFRTPRNGVWFTSNTEEASRYAEDNDSQDFVWKDGGFIEKNTASRIIPAYLSLQNPKILKDWSEDIKTARNYKKALSNLFDKFKKEGHDGVIINDNYVVFNANQIKSATANLGKFSPQSSDIRFQAAPSQPKRTRIKDGKIATESDSFSDIQKESTKKIVKRRADALIKRKQRELDRERKKMEDVFKRIDKQGIDLKVDDVYYKVKLKDDGTHSITTKRYDAKRKRNITHRVTNEKLRKKILDRYKEQRQKDWEQTVEKQTSELELRLLEEIDSEVQAFLEEKQKKLPVAETEFQKESEPKVGEEGKDKITVRRTKGEKITVDSKEALITRIKAERDAVKDALLSFDGMRKMLYDAESKNFITQGQLISVLRRITVANTVEKQKEAVDYALNIIEKGDYRKALSKATKFFDKFIKAKHDLGTVAYLIKDIKDIELNRLSYEDLLEINRQSSFIKLDGKTPDVRYVSSFVHYLSELEYELGERARKTYTEKELEAEIAELTSVVKKGFNNVAEVASAQRKLRRLRNMAVDVLGAKDTKTEVAERLATLLGEVNENEFDGGKLEQEIKEAKESYYDNVFESIKQLKPLHDRFIESKSELYASRLRKLLSITRSDLERFNLADLQAYDRFLYNLAHEHITPSAFELLDILETNRLQADIEDILRTINKGKQWNNYLKRVDIKEKLLRDRDFQQKLVKLIRATKAYRLDTRFGNYNRSKTLTSIYYEMGRTMSQESAMIKAMELEIEKIEADFRKHFKKKKGGYEQNDYRQKRAWTGFLMAEKSYRDFHNYNKETANEYDASIMHYMYGLPATNENSIAHKVGKEKNRRFRDYQNEKTMYNEFMDFLRKNDAVETIAGQEVMNVEKAEQLLRNEKGVSEYMDSFADIYEKSMDMMEIATMMNGRSFIPMKTYFPFRSIKLDGKPVDISQVVNDFNTFYVKPKMEASATHERMNKLNYIQTDPRIVTQAYINELARNFYVKSKVKNIMTGISNAGKTLVQEDSEAGKMSTMGNLSRALVTDLRYKIDFHYRLNSFEASAGTIHKAIRRITKGVKKSLLATIQRVVPEFTSNVLRATVSAANFMASSTLDLKNNFDIYSGIIEEYIGEKYMSKHAAEIRGSATRKKTMQKVEGWADYLITFSDTQVGRALFVQQFSKRFEQITGKKFNPETYANNYQYRLANESAIESSVTEGLRKIEELFNAKNPVSTPTLTSFMFGMLKGKTTNVFVQWFDFLQSFNRNETEQLLDSVRRLRFSPHAEDKYLAMRDIVAVITSNAVYNSTRQMAGLVVNSFAGNLMGMPDDEWTKKQKEEFREWQYYMGELIESVADIGMGGSSQIYLWAYKWFMYAADKYDWKDKAMRNEIKNYMKESFYVKHVPVRGDTEKIFIAGLPMPSAITEDVFEGINDLFTLLVAIDEKVLDEKEKMAFINIGMMGLKYGMINPITPTAQKIFKRIRKSKQYAGDSKAVYHMDGSQDKFMGRIRKETEDAKKFHETMQKKKK